MKKLFSILTLGVIVVLTSCEKDESSLGVTGVSVNKNSLTMAIGENETLVATVSPGNALNKAVRWNSSKPSIATVDENGKVTAVDLGEATITVTTADSNKTVTCAVMVELIAFVDIPAGSFRMGHLLTAPDEAAWEWDDGTQHQVALTKDFKISKHEVTNRQFCVFLNTNKIGNNGIWNDAKTYNTETLIYNSSTEGYNAWGVKWDSTNNNWTPVPDKENFPVLYVTWFGAKEFATWTGGDLPTEAQWEYACRGDRDTMPFGIGTGKVLDGKTANIFGRYIYDLENGGEKDLGEGMGIYLKATCAVGKYQSNSYGLYDMHGNISEWCNDWYATNYGSTNATDAAVDPTGPVTGSKRVARGGCWGSDAWGCHSASRYYFSPSDAYNEIGFRVVRP